jgi:hypothetical protein
MKSKALLPPFIGITDYTSYAQVKMTLRAFKKYRTPRSPRQLHVGVMMSYKTLHGEPSKFSLVFPPKETIAEIFTSDQTFNCLHYIDYHRGPEFWKSLCQAIHYGGMGLDAIQLDMSWPDPVDISTAVHTSRRMPYIILQVGKKAIDDVAGDSQRIVDKLHEYQGVIHYVLLDKSMGKGQGLDAEELLPIIRAIKTQLPWLKVAVAGGLGPGTVNLIEPLVSEFPDLSIDAQGRLRPSGDYLDPVDWDMACLYIEEACGFLK